MIPSNITRAHCVHAAAVVDAEGFPTENRSKKFDVVINGKLYPPKWIIHVANEIANGKRHPTGEFSGGNEANTFLTERGLTIRRKVPADARDYLFRWRPENVSVGKPLNYAASGQFRNLEPGDRIWVVTSNGDTLLLVGVIPVTSVGDQNHASRRLGNVPGYEAPLYAFGPKDREALAVAIDISDIADQLRFISNASDRLNLKKDLAQQLQRIRRLTPESVRLLAQALDEGDLAGSSGSGTSGAGFGDPDTNRRVERAAVNQVTAHFRSLGYTVISKELDRIGYDLLCINAEGERHVEVKGVQGDSPVFIVTANESHQAKVDPEWELVVVMSALTDPTMEQMTGSEFLANYSLKPIQFRAERART